MNEMDTAQFLSEFQDHLAPKLDTYEQAIYLYCVRHSRLKGLGEATIGFKSARKSMAFGIGKAGSPMSEAVCYEKLRSLSQKGCLSILGSERTGTTVKVFLPSEIEGVIPSVESDDELPLEEIDFFNVPENRQRILKRDGQKCFYCLREITSENYVLEHVVSRPEGNNSFKNLVAACRQCNNRKSNSDVLAFLRVLYREGMLSSEEFEERSKKLEALKNGELVPPVA